jgi:hypothetical protein
MSIPLVRNNTKDAINTSIIAIKKNLERINSLLGLADSSEPDLSGLATKQELEDAVTEINNTIDEVETSLQPVNSVTSGNMHAVTSNAVANSIINLSNYFTVNLTNNGYQNVNVTFGTPLPNANYVFSFQAADAGSILFTVLTKSENGFSVNVRNLNAFDLGNVTCYWYLICKR